MNLILDDLPYITPNGFEISTDFRNAIRFEILMQDNTIEQQLKMSLALNLFYKDIPSDIVLALNDIVWFYTAIDEREVNNSKKIARKESIKEIYSFEYDSEYIFSAFLDQYNIDLNSIDYLHWWKFKALFKRTKRRL